MRTEKLHRVVHLPLVPGKAPSAPLPDVTEPASPESACPSDSSSGPLARLLDGLRCYLRQERAFWTANNDVELSQLLDRLRAVVDNNRSLRKAASPLIFLIGSDLLKSQRDEQLRLSTLCARPMRAWRQRYNGLEKYLAA